MTDSVRRYLERHLTEPGAALGFSAGVDAVARTIEATAAQRGGLASEALLEYAKSPRAKVLWP